MVDWHSRDSVCYEVGARVVYITSKNKKEQIEYEYSPPAKQARTSRLSRARTSRPRPPASTSGQPARSPLPSPCQNAGEGHGEDKQHATTNH